MTASACIYRVPPVPAWNTRYTVLQFNLTGALLGPLFAMAMAVGDPRWLAIASATMAGAQFVLLAVRFLRCIASDSLELRGTARLLSTVFAKHLVARGVLLALGAIVLPLIVAPAAIALALAFGAEDSRPVSVLRQRGPEAHGRAAHPGGRRGGMSDGPGQADSQPAKAGLHKPAPTPQSQAGL